MVLLGALPLCQALAAPSGYSPLFERLTITQETSHAPIYDTLQDSKGFMWFATQEGLVRYDGYEFKVFKHDPADADSISGSHIRTLFEDSNGFLWIGSWSGGLSRFDRQTRRFINYRHDKDDPRSLSHDTVFDIHEDAKGVLWVATWGGGLNRFDRKSGHFDHFRHNSTDSNSLGHDAIITLHEDKQGMLWIGTWGAGLDQFNPTTREFKHFRHQPGNPDSLSNDVVLSIFQDSSGILWVGTYGGGLNRYYATTQHFESFRHDANEPRSLSHDTVYSIYEDSRGFLWAGTWDGGLNQYNSQTRRFRHFKHQPSNPHSLSDNAVLSISEDNEGRLWFGTFDGGLSQYDAANHAFDHYRHEESIPNSLSHNTVTSIIKDSNNSLWVGTYGGGLNHYDKQAGHFEHLRHQDDNPNSLSHDAVMAIAEDKRKNLWVGTWGGGLNKLDHKTGHFEHYRHDENNPTSLSNDMVTTLFADSKGALWLGTYGGGLNRYDSNSGQFKHFRHSPTNPNSISHDNINVIYENSRGELWIGTDGGLNRYEPENQRFVRWQHQPANFHSLSDNGVNTIFEDSKGWLWVGTKDGLNKYNAKRGAFIHYSEKDGLGDNTIHAIIEGTKGQLWISTNKGLSKFYMSTESFRNYDINDGLQNNLFSTGAVYRSQQDELFFGGVNGFERFFPRKVKDNQQQPTVVLTDFRLFNQSVPIADPSATTAKPSAASVADTKSVNNSGLVLSKAIDELTEITLGYQQNQLSFGFTALGFANPMKQQYSYRLQGWDKNWIVTDAHNRYASYNNLSPGHYTLQIKAANPDGFWNPQAKTLKITIVPPTWQTWWAYSAYGLALAALGIGLFQVLRRKIHDQQALNLKLTQVNHLKDEFLANTAHELRTPLNGITGLAESLIDGVGGPQSKTSNANLAMIVASGKRLANLVNDILDFSSLKDHHLMLHTHPVALYTLADEVLTLSRPLLGDKAVSLINAVPEDFPAVMADEARLQQILHNLVDNSIKFTNSGEITITAHMVKQKIKISVKDTGIGMAKDQLAVIFDALNQANDSIMQDAPQHNNQDSACNNTGLGLTVSQQLVQLHGGKLSVKSKPDKGSTFSFSLDACKEKGTLDASHYQQVSRLHFLEDSINNSNNNNAQDNISADIITDIPIGLPASLMLPEEDQAFDVHHDEFDGSHFRLLLVDDEPINRQVLSNHLRKQRYQLVEASGGEQALELIKHDGPFDLILLDVMMPQMSGYEVCQKLREKRSINSLPIIFLTAKNQVVDLVQGFAVGANDYLSKPVTQHELLARVETQLKFLCINRQLERKVTDRTTSLLKSNRKLSALSDICSQISAMPDINALLSTIYDRLSQLMDIDVFTIGHYKPEQQIIEYPLSVVGGDLVPALFMSMKETNRPAVWCMEHKKPLILNDYNLDYSEYFGDDPMPTPTFGKPTVTVMYWPLIVADRAIGVMTVQSCEKYAYNEHQQHMIQTLAVTTAFALDNAKSHPNMVQTNHGLADIHQSVAEVENL